MISPGFGGFVPDMRTVLERSTNRYLAFLDKLTPEQVEALNKYYTAVIEGYIVKLKEDLETNPDPNLKAIIEILEEAVAE